MNSARCNILRAALKIIEKKRSATARYKPIKKVVPAGAAKCSDAQLRVQHSENAV